MNNTIQKVKECNDHINKLEGFEKDFIQDNYARANHFGEATKFSEKLIAIVDRIHKERVVEGKPYKASEKTEG